jgi:hypothetical protein
VNLSAPSPRYGDLAQLGEIPVFHGSRARLDNCQSGPFFVALNPISAATHSAIATKLVAEARSFQPPQHVPRLSSVGLDSIESSGDNGRLRTGSNDNFQQDEESTMGDKGGKKDKDKSKKQKAMKQEQSAKGKKPSK